MSEPTTALGGAAFDGLARVEECPPQGMITLRGDLAAGPFARAVGAAAGVKIPGPNEARVEIGTAGATGLCWMSPDELLLLCPYHEAAATEANLAEALAGQHALVVNVSDARAMFRLSGGAARDVLAKIAPVDLAPSAFRPGMFRRTRLAQVAAAFWMEEDESFRILCFRSVARYVFDLLKTAAHPSSSVAFHAAPDHP